MWGTFPNWGEFFSPHNPVFFLRTSLSSKGKIWLHPSHPNPLHHQYHNQHYHFRHHHNSIVVPKLSRLEPDNFEQDSTLPFSASQKVNRCLWFKYGRRTVPSSAGKFQSATYKESSRDIFHATLNRHIIKH